jgi:hypothetical protein
LFGSRQPQFCWRYVSWPAIGFWRVVVPWQCWKRKWKPDFALRGSYLPGRRISPIWQDSGQAPPCLRCMWNYPIKDAAALGDLLSHFGRLGQFNIGQGEPETIHLLLSHCGDQPHLKSLMIFNVEVDDRILPVLAKWPTIETLALVPCKLTGEKFPLMPRLRSMDMSYSSINDKGLVQVASCPMLNDLFFSSTSLSSTAIIQAVNAGKTHLRKLRASDVELIGRNSLDDRERLCDEVRRMAPKLQFDLSN